MPTNNGQFQYPETDWAEGKMRMAKAVRGGDPGKEYRELEGVRKRKESRVSEAATQYPIMDKEEWQKWFSAKPNGSSVFAAPNKPISDTLKNNPEGFMTRDDHPDLKNLGDDYEINTTPDFDGYVLVRPKRTEPLTSEIPSMGRVG